MDGCGGENGTSRATQPKRICPYGRFFIDQVVANVIVVEVNERLRILNSAPVRQGARYVLYWCQMNQRVPMNQALEYAAEQANRCGVPLLVYEGLGCTYQYANDRIHTFIVEGVPDTAKRLAARRIGYCFYLRQRKSDGFHRFN